MAAREQQLILHTKELTFVLIGEGNLALLGLCHESWICSNGCGEDEPTRETRRCSSALDAAVRSPFLPKLQRMSIPARDSTKHLT